MIDRLSNRLEVCLNLKNEWGLIIKPSLLTRARIFATTKKEGDTGEKKRGKYRDER